RNRSLVLPLAAKLVSYQQQLADAGEHATQGLRWSCLYTFVNVRDSHVPLLQIAGPCRLIFALALPACKRQVYGPPASAPSRLTYDGDMPDTLRVLLAKPRGY